MMSLSSLSVSYTISGLLWCNAGSAFKNKGVQPLDAVINYLPSPIDLPPMKAFDDEENETTVEPDDGAKVAGLCFKLWTDPYVGKLVFFRNYQGVLRKGLHFTTLVLVKLSGEPTHDNES